MLAPRTGFAVFCAYAGLALAAGFILISRRDAQPPPARGGKSPCR
jgi:hypothetical protein